MLLFSKLGRIDTRRGRLKPRQQQTDIVSSTKIRACLIQAQYTKAG
jgi:hypothetical protein